MKRLTLSFLLFFAYTAFAAQPASPPCMNHGQVLAIDNPRVTQLKSSTPNGYLTRAHVIGTVTDVYKNQTGHNHFEITLQGTTTTLEVIYGMDFGGLTPIAPGLVVEACGDYITSNAWFRGYKPSPDNAIIHWVHRSDNPGHDDGYLVINGELFGQK